VFSFHHVGVVTADAERAAEFYADLGYTRSERFDDPLQRVGIILLEKAGSPMIEIVTPADPGSPAAGWLKRIKAGPYHTCYQVPDIAAATEFLRERGAMPLGEPLPAVAFGGRRVVFLFGAVSGLVELVEENP
jgi:methylmalonyl-CoA/ethylmalonyl-CoA epimerase